jgi:hypothetical protein
MIESRFFQIPELSLSIWSFLLNFFWEVTQTYFYTLEDAPFHTMLYGWLHCTLGDVLLTLGSFWLISLISWNRRWFLKLTKTNLAGFVLVGVGYTLLSEWSNVHIFKSWVYNELMPIIPLIRVGLFPVLQWIVVPSVIIFLLRHYLSMRFSQGF